MEPSTLRFEGPGVRLGRVGGVGRLGCYFAGSRGSVAVHADEAGFAPVSTTNSLRSVSATRAGKIDTGPKTI